MKDFSKTKWRAAGLLIVVLDHDKQPRVLLTLRSHAVNDPGMWSLPGGRVEPGETPWEAAVSEAIEELGSLPPVVQIFDDLYKSGDFRYTTFVVEMALEDAQAWTPKLNWENDAWYWCDPTRPPKQHLHPNVRKLLSRWR